MLIIEFVAQEIFYKKASISLFRENNRSRDDVILTRTRIDSHLQSIATKLIIRTDFVPG